MPMKVSLICGSSRKKSNSAKVADYFSHIIKTQSQDECEKIYLEDHPIALWDESAWNKDSELSKSWLPTAQKLQESDAFIIITPEWHGMVPGYLKNFFLFCSQREFGNKPALLTAVSSSRGGSTPIAELRISSYKNNRLCYIPEHVIVRSADTVLNDFDHPANEEDTYIRKRMEHAYFLLQNYGTALKMMREKFSWDYKEYPNGM